MAQKRSPKELVESAFKWSDNIIDKMQSSIDAGTISGDELEETKKAIEDYNTLKRDIMDEVSNDEDVEEVATKTFAAEKCSKLDLLAFAFLRKLIRQACKDAKPDLQAKLDELRGKLIELGVNPEVMDCIVAKCNASDPEMSTGYNKMLQELAANNLKYIEDAKKSEYDFDTVVNTIKSVADEKDVVSEPTEEEVKEFASDIDGAEVVESGIGFLESIVDRMENAEDKDEDQIEDYNTAITAMKKLVENAKTKNFSAEEFKSAKMRVFAALTDMGIQSKSFTCAMNNPEFVKILQDLGKNYIVKSISCDNNGHDIYEISNGDKSVFIKVAYNVEQNTFDTIELASGDNTEYVSVTLDDIEDEVTANLPIKSADTPAEVTEEISKDAPKTEDQYEDPAKSEIHVNYDPDKDEVNIN